jgi:hypothetical protein
VLLEDLADFDEIVTCLPVVREVLQAFGDERAFLLARDSDQSDRDAGDEPHAGQLLDGRRARQVSALRCGRCTCSLGPCVVVEASDVGVTLGVLSGPRLRGARVRGAQEDAPDATDQALSVRP